MCRMIAACSVLFACIHLRAEEPWREYLRVRTEQIQQQSRLAIAEVTAASWPEQQAQWRSQLQEMLGLSPWPERSDLAVEITGTLERDDYRLTKLSYQSRPGLYVTANLYEPTGEAPKEGWPAVLYVCGHANVKDEGRLLGNKTGYHHHGLWLARQGVVCLIIDTIQLGEMHGEHHGTYKLGRWDWITRGYTPAGVEAWNAIRAIDYLESWPSINKKRIGITGRSGGGAYSWFAAALDPRIAAAVPVAGITDLRNHIVDNCVEGHCDCMYFVNYYGWDYNRLAALIAPRPLMLANSDHDTIFPLDGVMRVHHDVADMYARLGAANKFGLLLTPGPHQDTQELQVGAFRWLLTHLTDQPVVVDRAATKELAATELQVFPQETPRDQHVSDLPNWFVPSIPLADPARVQDPVADPVRVQLPTTAAHDYTLLKQATVDNVTYRWYQQSAPGEQAWRSQLLVLQSNEVPDDQTVHIHLGMLSHTAVDQPAIERELHADGKLRRLVARSPEATHVVLLPRSQQLWSASKSMRELTHLERRFYLLGESTEQLALVDMLAQLNWLNEQTQSPTDSELRLPATDHWRLIGHGRQGPLAVLATLQLTAASSTLKNCKQLTLIDYPHDWRMAAVLPGLARHASLESLLASAHKVATVSEVNSHSPSVVGEGYDETHQLLFDTAGSPQQATGIRLVEPHAHGITVWCRATRWMLPNPGDQPDVEFADKPEVNVKQRRELILPADGTAGLRYAVPGVPAELRVRYRTAGKGYWKETPWTSVDQSTDYSLLIPIAELEPDTQYELQGQTRAIGNQEISSTLSGSFKTLPEADARRSLRLAVGTCQEFDDRDGEHGMDLYRTMLHRKTDAFILAGDVVYYDRLARSIPLAYYHWQRTYSLPTHLNFHSRVPTFFLKDDHDTYVNDSWPGQYVAWTGQFTFEDGQRIFRQQTGIPETPYRTIHFGKDLQVWMMEGRDFRDPNSAQDGPEKTIWGSEQLEWLENTLTKSEATFKVIVSPTPIVGPDRDNKKDNHANSVFATEGKRIRKLLGGYKNLVVVCGDRHWQYHSRDPETGLQEFSVGPVTNRHAGGWDQNDFRQEIHQFLRVGGGYLEIDLQASDAASMTLTHRDPYGQEHHQVKLP